MTVEEVKRIAVELWLNGYGKAQITGMVRADLPTQLRPDAGKFVERALYDVIMKNGGVAKNDDGADGSADTGDDGGGQGRAGDYERDRKGRATEDTPAPVVRRRVPP